MNSNNYNVSPGTFGYEWGGYQTTTGIADQLIGRGLFNTNSLIDLNLQPNTSGWRVLWNMVGQFRSSHSNSWFVPSLNELKEVYNQKYYLENLSSSSTFIYYWSSSENGSTDVYLVNFYNGTTNYDNGKNQHFICSRLCRYTTGSELLKTIQISTSTTQSQIYYTINNTTPTTSSTLYTDIFQVESGTTIKAIGVKEGYLDSNVAEFAVS